jgi:hypothetical protein
MSTFTPEKSSIAQTCEEFEGRPHPLRSNGRVAMSALGKLQAQRISAVSVGGAPADLSYGKPHQEWPFLIVNFFWVTESEAPSPINSLRGTIRPFQ